jgi:hypothetical protein
LKLNSDPVFERQQMQMHRCASGTLARGRRYTIGSWMKFERLNSSLILAPLTLPNLALIPLLLLQRPTESSKMKPNMRKSPAQRGNLFCPHETTHEKLAYSSQAARRSETLVASLGNTRARPP